jgi:hypothetical protein
LTPFVKKRHPAAQQERAIYTNTQRKPAGGRVKQIHKKSKKIFFKKVNFCEHQILKPPLTRASGNGTPLKNRPFFTKINQKQKKQRFFAPYIKANK